LSLTAIFYFLISIYKDFIFYLSGYKSFVINVN